MPLWLTVPICTVLALVIAFGVYGAFMLWDFYQLNQRKHDE